nr:MAG TPA: hypothetical protein [Caudoviricetes sp.]
MLTNHSIAKPADCLACLFTTSGSVVSCKSL